MAEVLRWFAYTSAALFWLTLLVGIIAGKRINKDLKEAIADIQLDLEDDQEWGWVVDIDEQGGMPMYVPDDIADRAVEVLNQETPEEKARHKAQQWRWVITPMGVRQAMVIAQEEPNLELAFLTWVAQQTPPPEED